MAGRARRQTTGSVGALLSGARRRAARRGQQAPRRRARWPASATWPSSRRTPATSTRGRSRARSSPTPRAPARVVLAPNHTGRGARAGGVGRSGAFALPGDEVPVDEELAARLLEAGAGFVADREAHRFEHALEVELPFLRARNPEAIVTPVILGGLDGAECLALGRTLAEIVGALGEEVLVVASSDMSHYLPDDVTRQIDRARHRADARVRRGPPLRRRRAQDISMCGVLPATAMLSYARARGATAGDAHRLRHLRRRLRRHRSRRRLRRESRSTDISSIMSSRRTLVFAVAIALAARARGAVRPPGALSVHPPGDVGARDRPRPRRARHRRAF